MKSKLSFALSASVIVLMFFLASCTDKDTVATNKQKITLTVSGFSTTMEGINAKASASEATDKISIAVFNAMGSKVYAETQSLSDSGSYATYGQCCFTLSEGEYTLVAVGYRAIGALSIVSPTNATFSNAIPDCFVGTMALSVNAGGNNSVSMALDRPVAKFTIQDTAHPFPSSVQTLEAHFSSGSKSFNPSTGFAISNSGYTRTLNTSSIPYVHPVFNYHVFLNAASQTMDVSITCRDSVGTINYQKTIQSVPLRRNCITHAVGSLFGASNTSTFTFNTTFASDTTITF